jgi:hypothetical protein
LACRDDEEQQAGAPEAGNCSQEPAEVFSLSTKSTLGPKARDFCARPESSLLILFTGFFFFCFLKNNNNIFFNFNFNNLILVFFPDFYL